MTATIDAGEFNMDLIRIAYQSLLRVRPMAMTVEQRAQFETAYNALLQLKTNLNNS